MLRVEARPVWLRELLLLWLQTPSQLCAKDLYIHYLIESQRSHSMYIFITCYKEEKESSGMWRNLSKGIAPRGKNVGPDASLTIEYTVSTLSLVLYLFFG